MNQAILFNDDFSFDQQHNCWKTTVILAGEIQTIYYHSPILSKLTLLDTDTKFDLEELTEHWFGENEPVNATVHIEAINLPL